MRVLVTNTRNRQAYTIMVALRPHVERIVITTHGRNRLAHALAPSARSRLVDARYPVPAPPRPSLGPSSGPAERRYTDALLDVCRREAVQVIIPSRDEVAYLLSKHKAQFENLGVAVPVPDFPVQARIIDKYEMLQSAAAAGIPIPRTSVPRTRRELDAFVDETGLPAIVKPRVASGGHGFCYLMCPDDLDRHWRPPVPGHPDLMVQEYIPEPFMRKAPGTEVVIDRQGRCKAMFQHSALRQTLWNVGPPCAATLGGANRIVADQTLRLLRSLGYWGAACVEWRRDERDGQAKLLEPNARLGATIWAAVAAGVNLPLILAQVALGQDPDPVIRLRPGQVYADPLLEVLSAGTYLAHRAVRRMSGGSPAVPRDKTPALGTWLAWLVRSCTSRRRVTSDYWRALGADLIPPVLFWAQQYVYVMRRWRSFLPQR